MTFPTEPRPMLFELQVGATDWANITEYVFSKRSSVDIDWGVSQEYSQADPTVCSFHINNANGLFSPRNPNSVLFGKIGRNTPVRASLGEGAYGMVLGLPGATESNGRAESVDSAQLSPTGDLDIRVDMEILEGSTRTWTAGSFDIASKFGDSDTQRSWALINILGVLRLEWFSLGTVASYRSANATAFMPGPDTGRRAVRATIDVNNGAAGVDVKFYTAPTMAGPWTQLGATVTSAGTSAIFDGTATTRIGAAGVGTVYTYALAPHATIYAAQLYASINDTNLIASPDFTTQPLDPVPFFPSNFADAQGNNWTYNGSADAARIWYGNVDIRAHTECSAFPNRWDTSGNDAWVPIESAGLLRRMGRGQEPAATGLYDWVKSQDPLPVSYFPLSGSEAVKYSVNQGRVGGNSFRFYPEASGAIKPVYTYGKDFESAYLGTGMELNATGDTANMRADVGTSDDNFNLDFVFQSPQITTDTGGVVNTNMGVLKILLWDYNYDRWQLQLQNSGNAGTLQVTWWAGDGVGTFTFTASGLVPALTDNEIHTCRFQIRSIGGPGQAYSVWIDGELIQSNSLATGRTINGTSLYQMFYSRYVGQTVMTLGHLTGWANPGNTPPDVTEFDAAARGYAGELAADRMDRMAGIGGIPLAVTGVNSETMPMGPQYSESKLSQLRDAEQADMGILGEPRDAFGLLYRTRASMVGQIPALTLDYSAGHIVPPFEPTDDDQLTKNDVTATRRDGDSHRETLQTGKLSVLEPPSGVGRYHDQMEYNVETDAMLPGIAAWQVNLGTIDQARYPFVTVDLGILAAAGLDAAARAVKSGDLLVVEGLQALGVYDAVRLLVLGGHETVSNGGFRHTITWNCAPYLGYEGAVYATSASVGDAHYDTNGSQLTVFHGNASPTLNVADTGGTLWTTDAAAFPFDIMVGGERMTVTNITGATSPQVFTVTRSVNGVVKGHEGGTDVRLADPAYYSL